VEVGAEVLHSPRELGVGDGLIGHRRHPFMI
jgi:hypothetical protein